jgi:integrase
MRRHKLTKSNIPALERDFAASDVVDRIYFDVDLRNFGLRLRKNSTPTWVIVYERGGVQKKLKLGDANVLAPDMAREKARTELAKIQLGSDPLESKAQERAKAKLTLASVINDYLVAKEPQLRPASMRETKRYLLQHFRSLHQIPIHRISRRDVAVIITNIAAKAPVSAARGRSHLAALFSWAIANGIAENNPVEHTADPSGHIQARERVVNDTELKSIWNSCADDDYGIIVRLLILLGCRREEIGDMRWSEINNGIWTIPAERCKNHRSHTLRLPALALDIIAKVPQDGDYLFGFRGAGFTRWGQSKTTLDERCGVKSWRLHDLRRTFATGLANLGLPPHTIEAALNHAGHRSGVSGVYNKATYETEVAIALQRWADHIISITTSAERKVIPLRV